MPRIGYSGNTLGAGGTLGPFPAAQLAADNLALPITTSVLAVLLGYDGATLDLIRSQVSGDAVAATGILPVQTGVAQSGGTFGRAFSANTTGDTGNGSNYPVASSFLYNEAAWERERGNVAGTLLASASRSATTSSADQLLYSGRGVRVTVNVTVVPGVDTITPAIEVKDPISGTYTAVLTGAPLIATGLVTLRVGQGITAAANLAAADLLARTWRVTVTHSAGTAFTYSVGYDALR